MNSHNLSKDLLSAVGKLLEGNYVKVEGDVAHVVTKEGKALRSFSRSDYGTSFKKEAYNYLNTKNEEVEVTEETIEEKKKLDKVDPKELKGTHADREDGDIDNDGDEDESDQYLHKKRKAVKKAMKDDDKEEAKEEADVQELSKKTLGRYIKKAADDREHHAYHSGGDHEDNYLNSTDPDVQNRDAANREKGMKRAVKRLVKGYKNTKSEAADLDADNVAKVVKHDCASHVVHKEHGEGKCIPGMHTLEEKKEVVCEHCKGTGKHGDEDCKSCNGTGKIMEGYVTHYDVMFEGENGPFIVENVAVEELEIISEAHHGHPKKKK